MFADIGNILIEWPTLAATNTRFQEDSKMTKRASTTAKVTKATACLIARYIESTGSGVMVRYRGQDYGVTSCEPHTDVYGRDTFIFTCYDEVVLVLKEGGIRTAKKVITVSDCTIRKTTLAALKSWDERVDGIFSCLYSETDGTMGTPAGRYIVSNPGGLVFDQSPVQWPNVSKFVDNTLGAETVGLWHDGDKVYLDANASFDTLGTAIAYGRAADQLAIFDAVDGVVIDC